MEKTWKDETHIGNALPVSVSGVGTLLDTHVGDQVAERVGLEDDGELELGSIASGELSRDVWFFG